MHVERWVCQWVTSLPVIGELRAVIYIVEMFMEIKMLLFIKWLYAIFSNEHMTNN